MHGDNNPRSLGGVASADAGRSEYEDGHADLFIEVVFDKGYLGGTNAGSRVSFNVTVRRAEIHVHKDLADTLDFPSRKVLRPPKGDAAQVKTETTTEGSVQGKLKADLTNVNAGVDANLHHTVKRTSETLEAASGISFQTQKTDTGYRYVVTPIGGEVLNGPTPWDMDTPVLRIKDKKADRKRGEPPEPRIEVICHREDLVIENIRVDGRPDWLEKLGIGSKEKKRLAVEQVLKEEVMKLYLEGPEDMSDPFARIVLSQVSPDVG